MAKQRIKYIDILRAIAIILVVVGHIPSPTLGPELHKWIYSFHIPLFFFISGMSLSFQDYSKIPLKNLLFKRFKRIYLPYLLWAIILSIPTFSAVTIPKILYGTHQSIASVTNSSLWFLPVLFLSIVATDIILHFLHKKKSLRKLPIILIIILLIALMMPNQSTIQNVLGGHNLPWGLDIVPMTIVFLLLGYLYQTNKSSLKTQLSKYSIPLIILSLAILTYFSLYNDTNYVLMAENRYGNMLYFFIAAIFGILASTLLSQVIDRRLKRTSHLMQKIGSDTLLIFILHKYPLQWFFNFIDFVQIQLVSPIAIPLALTFALALCIIASSFIKKYIPFLAGK